LIVIENIQSSLISKITYDLYSLELTIYFHKYYTDKLTYKDISPELFTRFSEASSVGKFYILIIKNNFKLKNMAKAVSKTQQAPPKKERPKTVNPFELSDKVFVKMSIDVTKLNKAWFFQSEKGGVYANITLAVNPKGETDQYGNLGMVTQDVPSSVYDTEKGLPKSERTKGNILGNGAVFEKSVASFYTPGSETEKMGVDEEINDDLPF